MAENSAVDGVHMYSDLLSIVQILLLIVELVLLVATLFIVQTSRKEQRGREQLIQEMYKAARIVSREDYFNHVMEGYQTASQNVLARVTGKKPHESEKEMVEHLISTIGMAIGTRGVEIRLLLPKSPGRISVGYRYTTVGATVRYHPGIIASDVRYMIIDDKTVVMGISEKTGEQEPTKTGYRIPSEGLAGVLKTDFTKLWESKEAIDYEKYVQEILASVKRSTPDVSAQLVSDQLDLDIEEVNRLLNHVKA